MTAKENKRTNNIIITCLICALVVLIPLTGVVADAAINAPIKDSVSIEDATVQTPSTEVKDPTTDVKDPSIGGAPSVGPSTGGDSSTTPDGEDNTVVPGTPGADEETEEKPEDSVVETVNPILGKTISLDSGIAMIYYIDKEVVKDAQVVAIEFSKPEFVGDETVYTTILVEDYKESVIGQKQALRFKYKGIYADELSIDVNVKIIADGEVVKTETYSVKEYAMKQLSKSSVPAKLKTLLVDMLNYGAAAQIYFDYNTDNLANADLTEEQKAYASAEMKDVVSDAKTVDGDADSIDVKGVSISLQNTIIPYVRFNLGKHNVEDIYATITFEEDGEVKTVVYDSNDFLYFFEDKYAIEFDELAVTQLRTVFTVEFFDKSTNEQIGDVFTYSVASYVVQALETTTDEELKEIVMAMMIFGDSSVAYFA